MIVSPTEQTTNGGVRDILLVASTATMVKSLIRVREAFVEIGLEVHIWSLENPCRAVRLDSVKYINDQAYSSLFFRMLVGIISAAPQLLQFRIIFIQGT